MQRKPLAAVVLIGAVVVAVVVGTASAAAAADNAKAGPGQDTGTNRGWDAPPRDAAAHID
jgi:Spy/CpxP family protein refolding chaperone